MRIRPATTADIDDATDLVERRRLDYQAHQPIFWRRAPGSAAATRTFFAKLVAEPETVFLVAEEDGRQLGFLIARLFPTPPVYAPGGDTWLIDDFCVADVRDWLTAGAALLAEASARVRRRGAAQIVVVCGEHDGAKAELLRATDLSIASTWWTKPLAG